MKKYSLFLAMFILPIVVKAFTGEQIIDGINYSIVTKAQTAKVLANNYSGDIVIPSTIECEGVVCKVNEIGKKAFYKSTITSVVIPSSIETIGESAFEYCKSLSTVNIPNSVTRIQGDAFRNCSKLTSIVLPDNEMVISVGAFTYCGDLKDVYCFATTPPSTNGWISPSDYGTPIFDYSYIQYATLHVPAVSLDLYKSSETWGDFKEIVAIEGTMNFEPGMKCSKPTISYSEGELTFYCETEGAICKSTITDTDVTSYYNSIVPLDVTYHISVFATKAGYENSETATATLCWIDVEPRTEGITNDVASVRAIAVMIQNEGGMLTINGADDYTSIAVYDMNGVQVGSAISNNGVAYVNTNLSRDSIAIVKIGNKSVKVIIK